jgi:hypothetical protein
VLHKTLAKNYHWCCRCIKVSSKSEITTAITRNTNCCQILPQRQAHVHFYVREQKY